VVWVWLQVGLGSVNVRIYWPLTHTTRTANNYSVTSNLHTLQITAANTKFSPACSVFTSRSLVTASDIGDSSASRAHVVTVRRISRNSQLSQSPGYFTTDGLPPITSYWRQAPWYSRLAIFFQLSPCGHSPYVTSSLTRGSVCRLQLLLALASAVILGSESRGTHDHILLSQIRDSPNLLGQVLVFISHQE
jgi:hypothetical protein